MPRQQPLRSVKRRGAFTPITLTPRLPMKLLPFTPERAKYFSLAYIALLHDEVRLTAAERRTHGKLLDRLDAVSTDAGPQGRELQDGGADVVIESAEYTLLLKMFEATPWRASISREVNAAEDFLKDCPEYEAPAKAPALVGDDRA